MKQLFTLLFISATLLGFTQDEVNWFQGGQEWYYNIYCFQEFFCGATHYQVSASEEMGGEEAVVLDRMIYSNEFNQENTFDTEFLRFENDTVWRYSTIAEEWHFLWDIGAEVGDIWTIQDETFYGYSESGDEQIIDLFKVRVDSVALWEEVPNSAMTNRRVVYTSPIITQEEESFFTFGPILEGVGPIGGAHDLIGNSAYQLLPLQGPSFQCFIDNGNLAYGEAGSPCFTLSTEKVQEAETPLIYPNPAIDELRW
ncbi:MAG: hypothetical protein AAF193_10920, partial [Bacteroidota bacterium]